MQTQSNLEWLKNADRVVENAVTAEISRLTARRDAGETLTGYEAEWLEANEANEVSP